MRVSDLRITGIMSGCRPRGALGPDIHASYPSHGIASRTARRRTAAALAPPARPQRSLETQRGLKESLYIRMSRRGFSWLQIERGAGGRDWNGLPDP